MHCSSRSLVKQAGISTQRLGFLRCTSYRFLEYHLSNHRLTIIINANRKSLNRITVKLITRRPVQDRRLPWPELHDRIIESFKRRQRAIDERNENLEHNPNHGESHAPSDEAILTNALIM